MNLVTYSLLVSLLNLDDRNFVSIGLSRPIIAGPILGYFLNHFYLGVFIGAVIELIIINLIPIGTYIPPKATIIIGLVMYLTDFYSASKAVFILPIIIIYSLFYGHVSKRITRLEWKFNDYLVEKFIHFVEEGKISFLKFNLLAILLNFVVYFVMTIIGIVFGVYIINFIISVFFCNCIVVSIFNKIYYFIPLFALSFLFNNFDVPYKFLFWLAGFLVSAGILFFFNSVPAFHLFLFAVLFSVGILVLYKFFISRNVYE